LTDVENASWIGVFGPANMPRPVVQLLSTQIQQAMQAPALRKRVTDLGFDLPSISQPDLVDYMGKEVVKWSDILKTTGVTLE
jgi:tripartite-type tricarboxylate transporter receptor subunit TctC